MAAFNTTSGRTWSWSRSVDDVKGGFVKVDVDVNSPNQTVFVVGTFLMMVGSTLYGCMWASREKDRRELAKTHT